MRDADTKWEAIVLSVVVMCGMLIACGEKPNPDQPEPDQPPQEDLEPQVEELYKSVLDTYYEVGKLQDNEPEQWETVHGEPPYSELPYVLTCPYWVSEGGKISCRIPDER